MEQGTNAESLHQSLHRSVEIRRVTVHVEVRTSDQTRFLDFDDDDYGIDEMPFVVQEFLDRVQSSGQMPCGGPGPQEYEGPQFGRQWEVCPTCRTMHDEGGAR